MELRYRSNTLYMEIKSFLYKYSRELFFILCMILVTVISLSIYPHLNNSLLSATDIAGQQVTPHPYRLAPNIVGIFLQHLQICRDIECVKTILLSISVLCYGSILFTLYLLGRSFQAVLSGLILLGLCMVLSGATNAMTMSVFIYLALLIYNRDRRFQVAAVFAKLVFLPFAALEVLYLITYLICRKRLRNRDLILFFACEFICISVFYNTYLLSQ